MASRARQSDDRRPLEEGVVSRQLVHYVFCKKAACNKSTELWFNFDGKPTCFSIYEFAIVMGLHCGEKPIELRSVANNTRLRETYFKINTIKTFNLLNKIKKWPKGKPQGDMLKIALVYFLESILLSSDPNKSVCQDYLSMVDNLETFNRFPWGSIVYPTTLE